MLGRETNYDPVQLIDPYMIIQQELKMNIVDQTIALYKQLGLIDETVGNNTRVLRSLNLAGLAQKYDFKPTKVLEFYRILKPYLTDDLAFLTATGLASTHFDWDGFTPSDLGDTVNFLQYKSNDSKITMYALFRGKDGVLADDKTVRQKIRSYKVLRKLEL
jgi:hypothetical protein